VSGSYFLYRVTPIDLYNVVKSCRDSLSSCLLPLKTMPSTCNALLCCLSANGAPRLTCPWRIVQSRVNSIWKLVTTFLGSVFVITGSRNAPTRKSDNWHMYRPFSSILTSSSFMSVRISLMSKSPRIDLQRLRFLPLLVRDPIFLPWPVCRLQSILSSHIINQKLQKDRSLTRRQINHTE
jgi:hypothetical protein